MRKLFRRVILTCVALAVVCVSFAQVTFKVEAPLIVSEGEPFPVEFALNAKPDKDTFTPPVFDGFNLIAGPTISTGTSIQIVNGDMTRTVNYTYTYILLAQQEGNFTIPTASVVVDKKRYTTAPTAIEVVKEQQQPQVQQSQSQRGGDTAQQRESAAANRVGEDDLFMRMILSHQSVYKGEPIRATIRLYSRVDIVNNSNLKMPTFNGFWAQDITPAQREQNASRETYNGKVYDTYVVREYLLYPQQAGALAIQPAEIDITAQIVVRSRNIDPFFGGGHEFYNVRRHLSTEEQSIDVKQLPAGAPASFSGAVGRFEITMEPLESTTIKANSAATLRVRVSGVGNMTFIQAPKLTLPSSFELYNVRTTESITTGRAGAEGYKEFEYPFIARAEGDYTIPSIEFSYFDSSTKAYNIVSTNSFSINVTPDSRGDNAAVVQRGASKMNIEVLGQDIHFIKLGNGEFISRREPLILSWLYFVIMGGVLLIYVLLFILLRRAMRDSKNSALRRGKMANKMAIQRFKSAKRYMDEGSERAFYEEMLRGLWGYMSDKLNIPVAELTKEYVREELAKRGCEGALIQSFADIITECDEAQYSPMARSKMGDVYGSGLQLVSKIESFVKRK